MGNEVWYVCSALCTFQYVRLKNDELTAIETDCKLFFGSLYAYGLRMMCLQFVLAQLYLLQTFPFVWYTSNVDDINERE